MESKEYWANPKTYNRTLYFGLVFIILFPAYEIYSVGTNITAIVFVLLISMLPGGYFLIAHRKYKNSPIITHDNHSITIQDPLSKKQTINLSSIKSFKKGSNGSIILKLDGFMKSARINGKVLLEKDKSELMGFLNASIENS